MDPMDAGRLRSDEETRVDQPLVIAVAWPEHHAVLAEGDRLSIEVSGNVADRQDCHDAGRSRMDETCPLIRKVRARFIRVAYKAC